MLKRLVVKGLIDTEYPVLKSWEQSLPKVDPTLGLTGPVQVGCLWEIRDGL